jgi:gas vesicle protein
MGVDVKHIATFLLGAAAGAAAVKYSSMSDEEKEKLAQTLKDKASKLKTEAAGTFDKAQDYFSELSSKGSDALKEHWSDVEGYLKNLCGKKDDTPPQTA